MGLTTDYAFILNLKSGTGTIHDGGGRVVNFTRINTVAKAITACLVDSEETKNRSVYVSELTMMQNQVVVIVNKIKPSKNGRELKEANISELLQQISENMKAGKKDFRSIMGSTFCLYFGGPDFGMPFPKLENELLGIPKLKESDVEAITGDML